MSKTLTQVFQETVARHGSREALRYKQNGVWKSISYAEYGQRARALGCGMIELGMAFGDRVALLSENRPEWVIADQGILMAGGATVPVYPTLTGKQSAYVINDCGAKIVLVSSVAHLKKLLEVREEIPAVTHLVVFDDAQLPDAEGVFRLKEVVQLGEQCLEKHGGELTRRGEALTPDSLASIVYTSGTTGEPKGAMLSHGNFQSNASEVLPIIGLHETDVFLSFLPLSHVLERCANFVAVSAGAANAYAESVDAVPANLMEVKPTILVSVPRLFEKIKARVFEKVKNDPPLTQKIFHWALGLAGEKIEREEQHKGVHFGLAFGHTLADHAVFAKIREKTGGNLRFCISGGAPLPAEVGRFFQMIGITIIEGYGLTETSPVIAASRPGEIKFGTVGRPIPGVEVKLGEENELLARGPNIMKGYYNNPEATAAVIDADGWFHTGDIAQFDEEGRIRIVDRKKEIIVMSNGKNVAPQPIENALKASLYVEQAMLVGDRRNFITALVVPNFEQLKAFASEHRLDASNLPALLQHPQVQGLFAREIEKACQDFANFERVKKFSLLPREFDPAKNELTPTLKVKRRVVCDNFAAEIEAMYTSEAVSA